MTQPNVPGEVGSALPVNKDLPFNAVSLRLDRLVVAVGRLASYLWLAVMGVILTSVFSRYALGQGSIALEEMSWHLFGAATMLTLGYAAVRNDHVRVDVIHEHFSLRTQAWIDLLGIVLLALPIMYLMVHTMVPTAWTAWVYQERSQAPSGLPYRFIFKSILPLGIALVMIALFSRALRCSTLLFGFPQATALPDADRASPGHSSP